MTPDAAFLDAPEISALLFHPRRCEAANGLEPTETRADGTNDLLFRAREGDMYFGALRDLRDAVTMTNP